LHLNFANLLLIQDIRCTAPSNNLDGGASTHQCQEHSDIPVEELELGILWDEYGLVGNVMMIIFLSHLFLFKKKTSLARTSTIGV
jgi:hypothetical protein